MKRKVYNQFRVKGIPKDEIFKEEIVEIIGDVFKVIEQREDVIKVKTRRHTLNPPSNWDLVIEEKERSFEIYIENTREFTGPYYNHFYDARVFMKQLDRGIDEVIHERRLAFNVERQAKEAKRKVKEGSTGDGALEEGRELP